MTGVYQFNLNKKWNLEIIEWDNAPFSFAQI